MPPKNWNSTYQKYITDEESAIFKKADVLKRNKIKYWRKNYPFFIKKTGYLKQKNRWSFTINIIKL